MSDFMIGANKTRIPTDKTIGKHMQGFANENQRITPDGEHGELWCRSFVIGETDTASAPVFVFIAVADIWSCTEKLKKRVLEILDERSPIGDFVTAANVQITGTHTHSAPAGYSDYKLYNRMTGGIDESFTTDLANAIADSLEKAFAGRAKGKIYLAKGAVQGCGANRSLAAFERNPDSSKKEFRDWLKSEFGAQSPAATDNSMTLLNFVPEGASRERSLGILNWYAIHPANLGQTNATISGDNKGHAAQRFEEYQKDNPDFVAAFANSNAGDVSGNVADDGTFTLPYRIDTARDQERMLRNGEKQFAAAQQLFEGGQWHELEGGMHVAHRTVDFRNVRLLGEDGKSYGRTYVNAIGISMFAGSTEDGDSGQGLREGITEGDVSERERAFQIFVLMLGSTYSVLSFLTVAAVALAAAVIAPWMLAIGPFWPVLLATGAAAGAIEILRAFVAGMYTRPITTLSDLEVKGHLPKPILMVTEGVTPSVLPIQQFVIGDLVLLGVPAEFTSVAGWKLKKELLAVHRDLYGTRYIALSGYANAYAQYVTTREEYDAQHYEGASTLFGPYTLDAYVQEFKAMARTEVKPQMFDAAHAQELAAGGVMPGLQFWRFEREPIIDPAFETALAAVEFPSGTPKKIKEVRGLRERRPARYACKFVDSVEKIAEGAYAGAPAHTTISVTQRGHRSGDYAGSDREDREVLDRAYRDGPLYVTALSKEHGISMFNVLGNQWSNLGNCTRFRSFWDAGESYYSTLQTVAVDDALYLLGRGKAGFDVYEWQEESGKPGEWLLRGENSNVCADKAAWRKPEHYKTIKTVVLSGELYLLARGAPGVRMWRLDKDGASGQRMWTLINDSSGRPLTCGLSDKGPKGWNVAEYYETIQYVVLDDTLYLVARAIAGLTVYSWRPGAGVWTLEEVAKPGVPRPFSDHDGWAKDVYRRSIQAIAFGRRIFVVGRNKEGLFTCSWAPGTREHPEERERKWTLPEANRKARLFLGTAWDKPDRASTIKVVVHRDRVAVLDPATRDVVDQYDEDLDAFDPGTYTGPDKQKKGEKKARQAKLKAFRKKRADPYEVRETLFLVARDEKGLGLYAFDPIEQRWAPVAAGKPPRPDEPPTRWAPIHPGEPIRCQAFSDANGGFRPACYETIGVISTADHGLLVYGRLDAALIVSAEGH